MHASARNLDSRNLSRNGRRAKSGRLRRDLRQHRMLLYGNVRLKETFVAVVLPFEHVEPSIERLSALVHGDLERVNGLIIARTGSEVTMIPEVANHLISSGGKRLRPMLTLAASALVGY